MFSYDILRCKHTRSSIIALLKKVVNFSIYICFSILLWTYHYYMNISLWFLLRPPIKIGTQSRRTIILFAQFSGLFDEISFRERILLRASGIAMMLVANKKIL